MLSQLRWLFCVGTIWAGVFAGGCNKAMKSASEPTPTSTEYAVKRLVVPTIKNHVVQRGGSVTVPIVIQRINCPDPVVLRFDNLPAGVGISSTDIIIPAGATQLPVTFTALATADAKEQSIFVYASAPNIKDVKQTFTLEVK